MGKGLAPHDSTRKSKNVRDSPLARSRTFVLPGSICVVLDPVNAYEQHVGARLLDFFGSGTPWQRRLWSVGLCLTLRELVEASDAVRMSALSEASLSALGNTAQALLGRDPGGGPLEARQAVQAALKSRMKAKSLDYLIVAEHERRCQSAYLQLWATELSVVDKRPGAERVARAVASHLLDLGYSEGYLHRWWKYRLCHQAGTRRLADLVNEAHDVLATNPLKRFEVLAPVHKSVVTGRVTAPPEWKSATETSRWLKSQGFDVNDVRHDGAFLFSIDAPDSGAASIWVSELLDQLSARTAVGTKHSLRPVGTVWVAGERAPRQIERASRGVWVQALERENQLFDTRSSGSIHAAIELLSHLQVSSPAAAVAGGWAAIEALLSETDDRATAAERLALLVACSFPRAELTTLSFSLSGLGGTAAMELKPLSTNRERCDVVLDGLSSGRFDKATLDASDQAAVARMLGLAKSPHSVMADVQEHAAVSLRRLYRQRNLVLHLGKTDGVALRASLRTTAPIVGAGIDRLIHAHYVDRASPLEVVARARLGLATVGLAGGPRCTSILG
jgi:hypothetical protein